MPLYNAICVPNLKRPEKILTFFVKSLFKPFSGVHYHPKGFLPKIQTANFFALFEGITLIF